MTLGELIAALGAADPTRTVRHGFTHPHSYRGYYNELAFEPAANVTVADMLADARSALGATYEGWKGGDFTMHEHTDCWLSEEGCASGDTISALLLELMLGSVAVEEPAASAPDTLPAWLYQRFAVIHGCASWDQIADGERAYWERQARAVRRAVARGGFKAVAPDAASVPPGAPVSAPQPSGVSESTQSPTGAPTGHLGDLPSTDRDALIAELLPAWEAMYEPGNVSDYLIGYANSEAGAKGAAEAWMRSQAEVTGRLEWVPWGDVTPMPDGYDRWFELAQQHDDGIDTGPGIVVRHRTTTDPAR